MIFTPEIKRLRILDLPPGILQSKILGGTSHYFTSLELFHLRQVCSDFSDAVKATWCHTVKEEMLE